MIHKPAGLLQLFQDLMPRLELAHKMGTSLIVKLRNLDMDVYSGGPMPEPDPVTPRKAYNAAEWAMTFTSEPVRMAAIREKVITRDGANVVADDFAQLFPRLVQAEADYHTTMPVLVGLIQAVVDAHGGRIELLTPRERANLADAIEQELEV